MYILQSKLKLANSINLQIIHQDMSLIWGLWFQPFKTWFHKVQNSISYKIIKYIDPKFIGSIVNFDFLPRFQSLLPVNPTPPTSFIQELLYALTIHGFTSKRCLLAFCLSQSDPTLHTITSIHVVVQLTYSSPINIILFLASPQCAYLMSLVLNGLPINNFTSTPYPLYYNQSNSNAL